MPVSTEHGASCRHMTLLKTPVRQLGVTLTQYMLVRDAYQLLPVVLGYSLSLVQTFECADIHHLFREPCVSRTHCFTHWLLLVMSPKLIVAKCCEYERRSTCVLFLWEWPSDSMREDNTIVTNGVQAGAVYSSATH